MTPQANKPIASLKNFQGWYFRGANEDCPQDHLTNCVNCIFPGSDVSNREGLDYLYTSSNGQVFADFFVYSSSVKAVSGIGTYPMLYLDGNRNLYDAGVNPNHFIYQFAVGTTQFSATEISGRVFITPKANGLGIVGENTYYWDGANFSQLAGIGPIAGPSLAQANVGIVNAGVHNIAVSFLYRTGYLSPPSPLTAITSTGVNDIEVSAIPTGGTGVVGRVLLMTLSGQSTMFFIPGGTINDNTTTTFVINIYDTSLLSSADYLYDVIPSVPSCSSIKFYRGRIVLIGRSDSNAAGIPLIFTLLLSDVGIYDSFNNISNIINTPRDNLINAPNTALIINSILYILKPYGTYQTQDNGGNPASWTVDPVDTALGSYDTSVSIFSSGLSGEDILDSSFVIHPRGVLTFNGSYSDPPLSWKIDSLWQSFVANQFPFVRVANDIIKKRLYIIPSKNTLLMMDYSNGINPQTVKWSLWTFQNVRVIGFQMILDQAGFYKPAILITDTINALQPSLCTLNSTLIYDLAPTIAIGQYISTPFIIGEEGAMTCYNGLRIRITGNNVLSLVILDEDFNAKANPGSFNLSTYTSTAQDLFRGINYTGEKMSVGLIGDSTTVGVFTLKRLDIFGIVRWKVRPALSQST